MKTSNFNNSESKNNQVFNSRKEQYEAIKYGRPWYLLLFYWGAHYAAYDKDAETVAEVLDGMDGVTTYEECGMKCTVFPVDALAEALPKLRARNEYISVCDNLSHNGLYSRRTLADILNRNKTGRYYGECTDVFTSSDDREQADVKAEGCEVVRHIYYRIDCPDYEAGHDIDAFYSEVVKLLEAEGWHVEGDWQGAHCPTMRKGAQSLYCHPQSLSGEVSPVECDRIGQVLMTGKTFRLHGIDDYGRIFLTASDGQERDLYRQNYQDGLADMLREVLTTKRSNLYRDKGDALGNAYRRTAIENIRTDLDSRGTNYYYMRKAVTEFVDSEYNRLLQAGYIKEAKGQNGRTLCRWINTKEERELKKAKREAEKAAREQAERDREERKQQEADNALQQGREISDQRKRDGLPIGEGELVVLKEYGGALGFITKANGDELTFRHISGNWTAHPSQDEVARIEDVRPSWCQKGQTVMYDGKVYVIEIVDFFGNIEHSLESEHVCCICEQGKECICQNCRDVRWECLTPCTPDGRELLPEPPAEIVIDEEPTLETSREIKPVCIEGVSLTAEKRTKWVKNFGDIIREHTTQGRETQYNHDCGCIRVEVAYRNDSDKPEDWKYCVSWYRWLDIETEKRELVECENGIRLEQAARAMADFHLLADAGLTLQQILYPAA